MAPPVRSDVVNIVTGLGLPHDIAAQIELLCRPVHPTARLVKENNANIQHTLKVQDLDNQSGWFRSIRFGMRFRSSRFWFSSWHPLTVTREIFVGLWFDTSRVYDRLIDSPGSLCSNGWTYSSDPAGWVKSRRPQIRFVDPPGRPVKVDGSVWTYRVQIPTPLEYGYSGVSRVAEAMESVCAAINAELDSVRATIQTKAKADTVLEGRFRRRMVQKPKLLARAAPTGKQLRRLGHLTQPAGKGPRGEQRRHCSRQQCPRR